MLSRYCAWRSRAQPPDDQFKYKPLCTDDRSVSAYSQWLVGCIGAQICKNRYLYGVESGRALFLRGEICSLPHSHSRISDPALPLCATSLGRFRYTQLRQRNPNPSASICSHPRSSSSLNSPSRCNHGLRPSWKSFPPSTVPAVPKLFTH